MLAGINVLMAWIPGHWNLVIINALGLYVDFVGYPQGSASELLDGTLKLRYCTSPFTKRFPHGLYLGLVLRLVKGS